MKRISKRIAALLLALVLCMAINIGSADAASVTIKVSLSASSISIGKTVTATVKVSGSSISAYSLNISYDSSVLSYVSGSGATINGGNGTIKVSGTAAGSITIKFKAVANGSCKIKTSGDEFYDIDYGTLSVSHGSATVTVATSEKTTEKETEKVTEKATEKTTEKTTEKKTEKESEKATEKTTEKATDETTEEISTEEDNRSNNYYLKSLDVSPGTLEPEFTKKNKNYTVELDKDATSIVVSAASEDDKASVSVSGDKNLKPGENTVKVSVTAENGAVRVYKIKVNCGPVLGDAKTTVDGKEYDFASGNLSNIPEGFTEVFTTYEEWDVLAYESPNKKIQIVPLSDSEGSITWYIYDIENKNFERYSEFSSEFNRYIIRKIPDTVTIPEGYQRTEVTIEGLICEAAESVNNEGIYLVYAMNLSGSEGLYFYDSNETSFLRYVEPYVSKEEKTEEVTTAHTATPLIPATTEERTNNKEDKGLLSSRILKILLATMAFLFLASIIILILMGVKISSYKNYEDSDDEYDAENDENAYYNDDDLEYNSNRNINNNSEYHNSEYDNNDESDYAEDNSDSAFGDSIEEAEQVEEKASIFETTEEYNGFVLTNEGDYVEKQSDEVDSPKQMIERGVDSAFDITEDHIKNENLGTYTTTGVTGIYSATEAESLENLDSAFVMDDKPEMGTDISDETLTPSEAVSDEVTEAVPDEVTEPASDEVTETVPDEMTEAVPDNVAEAVQVTAATVVKEAPVEVKRNRIELPDEDDTWE